jgi:protocatechuate 3,4-dioxygenase beta subunit
MTALVGYRREDQAVHPPYAYPDYVSTQKRAPSRAPIRIPHTLSEITGPRLVRGISMPDFADLTRFNGGEALGERIIVTGRVLDEDEHAVAGVLIEIWQANAAGRYAHEADRHDAPLDPHFTGAGYITTDTQGNYRFLTIRPGAYPWANHYNAWRPNHIHLSLFGPGFASRLVTQMYFPGDPLLELDPIFNSVPDRNARHRLIARFDIETTIPERAIGYRFDLVLRGRNSTPNTTSA